MHSNPSFQKPGVNKKFHMRNICKTLSFSIFSWLASGFSNAASYAEHSLKAASLYNFPDFITWPSVSNNAPVSDINYCALHNGQVRSSLSLLICSDQDPTVKRNFSLLPNRRQITTCHLLFLDSSDLITNPNLLEMTSGAPVLTVSDQKEFLEKSGIIKLARENNLVKVHLNVDKLTEYAFPVSSQLMRQATIYPLDYYSEASE